MCTQTTSNRYRVKIFYRKPRYTHYCSVWNIILSSLYQKCMIWALKPAKAAPNLNQPPRRYKRFLEARIKLKLKALEKKIENIARNQSKRRRFASIQAAAVSRDWPSWRATGIKPTAMHRHLIRWNSRGENMLISQSPRNFFRSLVFLASIRCIQPTGQLTQLSARPIYPTFFNRDDSVKQTFHPLITFNYFATRTICHRLPTLTVE